MPHAGLARRETGDAGRCAGRGMRKPFARFAANVNPPDCPAQKGQGTDIIAADFGLAVREDLASGPVTQMAAFSACRGRCGRQIWR